MDSHQRKVVKGEVARALSKALESGALPQPTTLPIQKKPPSNGVLFVRVAENGWLLTMFSVIASIVGGLVDGRFFLFFLPLVPAAIHRSRGTEGLSSSKAAAVYLGWIAVIGAMLWGCGWYWNTHKSISLTLDGIAHAVRAQFPKNLEPHVEPLPFTQEELPARPEANAATKMIDPGTENPGASATLTLERDLPRSALVMRCSVPCEGGYGMVRTRGVTSSTNIINLNQEDLMGLTFIMPNELTMGTTLDIVLRSRDKRKVHIEWIKPYIPRERD